MVNETREMTPGDRRELRSLVKKQFAVLRADVKRREQEMASEIESELLRRYRDQDERIMQAQAEVDQIVEENQRRIQGVLRTLRDSDPNLTVGLAYGNRVAAQDKQRKQLHDALKASIPQQVASALTKLDQDELSLLRELTVGALDSEQAQRFLAAIPTVGELVPKARLAEIEGAS